MSSDMYKTLKEHGVNVLTKVLELFKANKFDEVEKMLTISNAGDSFGDENYFIDFAYDSSSLDIHELMSILRGLKE